MWLTPRTVVCCCQERVEKIKESKKELRVLTVENLEHFTQNYQFYKKVRFEESDLIVSMYLSNNKNELIDFNTHNLCNLWHVLVSTTTHVDHNILARSEFLGQFDSSVDSVTGL